MQTISLLAGGAILLLSTADLLWTTLSLRGAGPVSSILMRLVWESFRLCSRGPLRKAMAAAGVATLVVTLVSWVVLAWLGWLLIFSSDPGSIVASSTKAPADAAERVYFVGFVLSTLGVGDYVPDRPVWQVVTPVAAVHGLMVMTIAITYLVGALSAGVTVRQLAAHVDAIGSSPQSMLLTGWNGRDFGSLASHLTSITPTLLQASQMYLAYPVLHYFYSEKADAAPSVAIARLEEALSLLEHGLEPRHEPDRSLLRPPRRAIDAFLDKVGHRYANNEPPPAAPSLQPLRDGGLATVDQARFDRVLETRAAPRRILHAMVRDNGWEWGRVIDRR